MSFKIEIDEEFAHTKGFLLYRPTGGKIALFGFEDNAISLYPSRERAEEAAVHAAAMKGGEWRVGAMRLVVPLRKGA